MNNFNKSQIVTRTLGALGMAAALAVSASAQQGMRVGNPYTPTGADYSITALQGIDSANPLGETLAGTQVNINFEDTPSIGVTYQQSNGKLEDTALGLDQTVRPPRSSNSPFYSTGLMIN